MNKISLNSLQVDTILNTHIYLDEKYILLAPDVPFTQELKNRLETWGFTTLLAGGGEGIEDAPAGITAKKAATAQGAVEQSLEEQKREKDTEQFYLGCLNFLNEVFDRFLLDGVLRLAQISDKVKEIKDFTREYRQNILTLPDRKIEGVSYNICHAIKTTFLSLILSEALKMSIHQQLELGVASLFHRIGMTRLPPELYMSNRVLTPEEKKSLRAYPVLSFRILKAANFPTSICQAVLDHTERIDGRGYPQGLTGDKISVMGKIIAVASSYAASTARRPFRDSRDGHAGIMNIIQLSGTAYEPLIIKAMIAVLSIYPIGTYVELSDHTVGIVIRTDANNPKSPYIRLIMDANGEVFPDFPVLQPGLADSPGILKTLSPAARAAAEKIYKDEA
ncbi:MAG: hypothetical protein LBQ61_05580 [Spirochaetales bacterium]|jgi:HD-GYP domain-containing protein (c-di-GMP phosphodiesterase class II)|nr:hypothetical protein [Spirochaetales bacterium]